METTNRTELSRVFNEKPRLRRFLTSDGIKGILAPSIALIASGIQRDVDTVLNMFLAFFNHPNQDNDSVVNFLASKNSLSRNQVSRCLIDCHDLVNAEVSLWMVDNPPFFNEVAALRGESQKALGVLYGLALHEQKAQGRGDRLQYYPESPQRRLPPTDKIIAQLEAQLDWANDECSRFIAALMSWESYGYNLLSSGHGDNAGALYINLAPISYGTEPTELVTVAHKPAPVDVPPPAPDDNHPEPPTKRNPNPPSPLPVDNLFISMLSTRQHEFVEALMCVVGEELVSDGYLYSVKGAIKSLEPALAPRGFTRGYIHLMIKAVNKKAEQYLGFPIIVSTANHKYAVLAAVGELTVDLSEEPASRKSPKQSNGTSRPKQLLSLFPAKVQEKLKAVSQTAGSRILKDGGLLYRSIGNSVTVGQTLSERMKARPGSSSPAYLLRGFVNSVRRLENEKLAFRVLIQTEGAHLKEYWILDDLTVKVQWETGRGWVHPGTDARNPVSEPDDDPDPAPGDHRGGNFGGDGVEQDPFVPESGSGDEARDDP